MTPPDLQSDDYYAVLGVPRNADTNAIKKAYRKLAMRWHPDKNAGAKGAEEAFKRVSEAYDVLSDPTKRAVFDRHGKRGLGGGPPPSSPSSAGFPGGGGAKRGASMSFRDSAHLFAQFFGGVAGGGDAGVAEFDLNSLFGGLGGGPGGGLGDRAAKRRRSSRVGGADGGKAGRSPFNRLGAGDAVIVRGVGSRPALNGLHGTVAEFDRGKGRYVVMLRQSGQALSVRPECVVQAVDGVRVTGITSRPSANGQPAQVVGWDEASRRFQLRLKRSGELLAVRPENVVWPAMTLVRVQGLRKTPRHNHKWGRVEAFDGARYTVQVGDNGHRVRLRPANVAVACGA